MTQDYKIEATAKDQANHVFTLSRKQALHYARTMQISGKWDSVSIWKDGKEYKSNEWEHLP